MTFEVPMANAVLALVVATVVAGAIEEAHGRGVGQDVGPVVGHVDAEAAHLLVRRGSSSGRFRLEVVDEDGRMLPSVEAAAEATSDFVARFRVNGLQPDTRYTYRIVSLRDGVETPIGAPSEGDFRTASLDRRRGRVSLCFTSCVDIEENPMWAGIRAAEPDMLFLMGDTPYIDSSNLETARERHRSFLAMPGLADLVRSTPTVGTWDDHDFGRNNGNGRNMGEGRSRTRRAFVEYRAHDRYGTGTEGVFHKVDLGLVEVFLLDPRYFAQTEPSPVDPRQPTCFGEAQWDWIVDSLRDSEAPFKVLATGSIWQDKKNAETDDLFTYWYERDALLDLVKREGIPGVVLLGGDIHVSRHLVHRERVGYDLHDFVVSPGHERTITGLDVFHPDLRWSLVEGRQYLVLTVEEDGEGLVLTAEYRQGEDRLNRVVRIPIEEATPRPAEGLDRDLRARWHFDTGLEPTGAVGPHLETTPSHEDMLVSHPDRGGVARFERDRGQFISIRGDPLDDNSDRHTVALWCRPSSLPRHGSADRMFLYESTAEGTPDDRPAWHLSLGLRAGDDPGRVNLQLHSHTLAPAARLEAAPQAQPQGGFDLQLDRETFDEWVHVACTFDSTSWTIFLDGEPRVRHRLPMPGPASEFGGLVVGGHRAGRGRNFDGRIDDLALWARVLSEEEIRGLARTGRRDAALEEDDGPRDDLIGGAVQPRPRHEVPADPRTVGNVVPTRHRPFAKELVACGIVLAAEDAVSDDFLVRVGRVVAEMFPEGDDIDAGRQAEVLANLHAYGAMLPVPRTERSLERLFDRNGAAIDRLQSRYSICDIIMERVPAEQKVMEVVEHLLHAITDVGLHHAYPEEWGLSRDSALWNAMTRAIEEGYYDIGGYDDLEEAPREVIDRILMQEFAYWFITTAWDLQVPYGPREDEWTLRTPADLRRCLPEFLEIWERTGGRIMRAPSREALRAIGPARRGS